MPAVPPALIPISGDTTEAAPIIRRATVSDGNFSRGRSAATLDQNILEAWSQGLLFGTCIVLIMFTVSNMRRHVLLHKLILLELCLILGHETFIFCRDPVYGWYLSATAVPLYQTWFLHSVIAWLKNRPFLPRWGSMLYISTVMLAYPYWLAETVLNFFWFNNLGNDGFKYTRPYETFFRDPWWMFTTFNLIYVIKKQYSLSIITLVKTSPRFGVLLFCMFCAMCFAIADLTVSLKEIGGVDGINPYWKLSTVFKCASDTLFLDDFKRVVDSLAAVTMRGISSDTADLAITCRDLPPPSPFGPPPDQTHEGFSLMLPPPPQSMTTVPTTRSDDAVLGSDATGGDWHRGRRGSGRVKKKRRDVKGLFRSFSHAEGTPVIPPSAAVDNTIIRRDHALDPSAPPETAAEPDAALKRISTRRPSKVSGIGSDRAVDWFDIVPEERLKVDEEPEKPQENKETCTDETRAAVEDEEKERHPSSIPEAEELEFADVGGLADTGGSEKR